MKNLIEHLNKANWLQLIEKALVPGDEIIACFWCGSRCTPYIDEESDYDIQVLTKSTCYFNTSMRGEYKGQHLHWWYIPWDVLTASIIAGNNWLVYFTGMYSWKYLKAEHLLYINPKYQDFINHWLTAGENLSQWVIYNLAHYYRSQEFQCHVFLNEIGKSNWIWLDYYGCSTDEILDFKRHHFELHSEDWYRLIIRQSWDQALLIPNKTQWFLEWHNTLLSLIPKDDSN